MQTVVQNVDLSEELQNRLLTVMDWIGESAKAGVDLAGKELPLLLREIAIYGAVSHWTYVLLGLLAIFIFCMFLYNKNKKPLWVDDGAIPTARFFLTVVFGVFAFIGIHSVFLNIDDAIKATFAPRVYVIEWSAEQIKKINR